MNNKKNVFNPWNTKKKIDHIYTQVSIRDITLEYLQITPTKFRGSTFPGNMHNYIWCPYYLPSFMKFCLVVSEELRWQAASEVYKQTCFIKQCSEKYIYS